MTIALAVKVHEGVVLATDSASTMVQIAGSGPQVVNIYNNANKLFNLVKGEPIGGMTWGSGSIGTSSISTVIKDLRRRMRGVDPPWHLDRNAYTIKDVATRVKLALEERITQNPNAPKANGGFLVTGYSVGAELAECWLLQLQNGVVLDPVDIQAGAMDQAYCFAEGQPDAVWRLLHGFSPTNLGAALAAKGVPPADVPAWMTAIQGHTGAGLITPAMPIRDAIDLAEFLANVAVQFSRFAPGPATVGGPIDLAAITKHEGFRWIARKHYFESKYNPPPEPQT